MVETADTGLPARDVSIRHEACDTANPTSTADANGDGKPEIIDASAGRGWTCRALDFNTDGAIDVYIYRDAAGLVTRRENDFDRDGRPDEIASYEAGVLVRKELELNYDDKIDTWEYYEAGKLARRERDSNGDKVVDQWWNFVGARPGCARVTGDQNNDGKPDEESGIEMCDRKSAPQGGDESEPGALLAGSASSAAPSPPPPPPASAAPAGSAPRK